MFPASAGMNRIALTRLPNLLYVPRERGDEPWDAVAKVWLVPCSPRARG